jgi:hypothetical protein
MVVTVAAGLVSPAIHLVIRALVTHSARFTGPYLLTAVVTPVPWNRFVQVGAWAEEADLVMIPVTTYQRWMPCRFCSGPR